MFSPLITIVVVPPPSLAPASVLTMPGHYSRALDPLFHFLDLESSEEVSKHPKFPSWPSSFLAADLNIPLLEMVIEISHHRKPPRREW
ncbi:hypothetical protein V6N12_047192 [Hibiscus sabdariffa]|uniref:Secreted protein n=1 Tax=Hibiscus sabdariffa TaxID=183260 RepID=A0ABR2DA65_9ROSI